mgnify:CR=1 FL=1
MPCGGLWRGGESCRVGLAPRQAVAARIAGRGNRSASAARISGTPAPVSALRRTERNFTIFVALDSGRVFRDIALVQHHDPRNLVGADLGEHRVDGGNLRAHDRDDSRRSRAAKVGVDGFLQRTSKGGDQIVRQIA